MSPELSVIIPHHRDEPNLKSLVDSLLLQVTSFDFEVLVISNPPSEDCLDICQKAGYRYLSSSLVGANRARNIGLAEAKGKIALFLDSDCILHDRDLLQKHYNFHVIRSEVACLGGLYEILRPSRLDQVYNYVQRRWLLETSGPERSSFLLGGHFSCKMSFLKDLRFDEKMVYGGTETELFFRLKQLGLICILDPALKVIHNTRVSAVDLVYKLFRQGQGSKYIETIHPSFAFENPQMSAAVRRHAEEFQTDLQFYLFLAEEAFRMGKRQVDRNFSMPQRLIFIGLRYFSFKKKKTLEFIRSIELLYK